MRAGVEQVGASGGLVEHADRLERPEHRHQHRGSVDHRRVDDLALAAALRFEQCAHDAVGEEHAATTEVADHVERRHRRLARSTEVGERTRERDVVDVVTGGLRIRPVLAPAGHPSEHQLRVPGVTGIRADSETFHHAGAEPFDQRIGRLDEGEQRLDAVGVLEVDRDVLAPAQQHVEVRRVGQRSAYGARPLDPDHLGTHVGEQHRGERAGPDAGDLDDLVAVEWSNHGCQLRFDVGWVIMLVRTCPPMASASTGHSGAGWSWPMSDSSR